MSSKESQEKKKSKMPQIGEAVFCIIYLIFGYVAGIAMLPYSSIFGALTLVLAAGDSVHLIPRIINAFAKRFEKYEFWAGLGLMVSSITMTIFYVILYYACEMIVGFGNVTDTMKYVYYVLLVLAAIRIILCLFPQNNWFHKEGNAKWGIIRNAPFVVIGIIAVWTCMMIGQIGIGIAIVISFGCYLPVVLWAKKKPMLGMLMIPKTIAYMCIIGILLTILF